METLVSLFHSENLPYFSDLDITGFILADKSFSSSPNGMSRKELAKTISLLHKSGQKAVVKVDRLYEQQELNALTAYLTFLDNRQCDAVLFSDIAIKELKDEHHFSFATIYAPETLLTNRYEIRQLRDDGIDAAVISKDIPMENALAIAADSSGFCYLRAHGPILMSYSKRRFISIYLGKKAEYQDHYYLSEENRDLQMPVVEKRSGTWFYHSCLQSLQQFRKLSDSALRGLLFDNCLYDDNYTAQVMKLYQRALKGDTGLFETLQSLDTRIHYTDISEIRLTQLEKE